MEEIVKDRTVVKSMKGGRDFVITTTTRELAKMARLHANFSKRIVACSNELKAGWENTMVNVYRSLVFDACSRVCQTEKEKALVINDLNYCKKFMLKHPEEFDHLNRLEDKTPLATQWLKINFYDKIEAKRQAEEDERSLMKLMECGDPSETPTESVES